jgi:two-component system sensor histidine kinase HydH
MMEEFQSRYNRVIEENIDWRNVLDSIPDMVCILDKDARIRRVNRSFQNRLDMPLEKIIGATCHEVLHAVCIPPSACPLKTALETGMPVRLTRDLEIGDSLFSASIIPFTELKGVPAGAVLIFYDIAEQKKLNEKVTQARKMEALGRMAGEIAHEINNPLLYISNYLYLFSEELPPDFGKREYVDKIQGGVDRLTAFTRSLLDFSRPAVDELLPVDIPRIIETSLELMEDGLREKKIELVRRFGCGSHLVSGSEKRLRQVFMNLIQNAVDALEPGGSLSIKTSCSRDLVTLEFEDTGAGITAENVHRLFDPFFTTKKNSSPKGAGLGLAVCYNIIRRHQGEISVASKPGKGTTFTITLPAVSRKGS